ncbi:MAG TPA: type II toxin-antitoxin system VapC family toxin [Gaiella sp.]|nr:type II toxin-antitoxin system VapC family toxin [Gaiella sp.]
MVVDASLVLGASSGPGGFERFAREQLVAPPLMWSEARSSLHEALWRGEIGSKQAAAVFDALHVADIEPRQHPDVGRESWRVADELGWAKTYDAEYVALARLLDCRLVTLDGRLRRGADRLGVVVLPSEL